MVAHRRGARAPMSRAIVAGTRNRSMQALVTTSHSVLLVDAVSGTWRPIHRGMGLYYGICRHRGAIWVAARRRGVDDGNGPGDDRGCLVRFSPHGPPQLREYEVPLLDLHGIASVDGAIWCTCTFDNAITLLEGGEPAAHYPLGRPAESPFDQNHLNTLVEVSEGILALAHNWGESEVVLLDRKTMAVTRTWRLGVEAHNIWFDGDALRVCSSKEGMLVGDDGLRVRVGGFPRGYASDGKMRLVGITPQASREARDQTTSSIKLIDRDYEQLSETVLDGEGMVLDIMLLSQRETKWATRLADAYEYPERTTGVLSRIVERVGLGSVARALRRRLAPDQIGETER